MEIPTDLPRLTALFQKYGAPEPKSWAHSQAKEAIPQLQRFLFLRQAWQRVIGDGDTNWIDRQVQETERYPDGPYAGVGGALKRCLAQGVLREDLTDIARGMQAELLFSLCYLLDDPGFLENELQDFC